VHSGSCGALLRLCEAICDLFRFYVRATMLGLRGRYRTMISNCRRRRLGPAGILGFRATVTPLLGSVTLPVESSLLHCSGFDDCRKKAPSCFPPTPLVSNGGSIRMMHFLRACVNFFAWGAGMTILTAPGNLLAILPKEETGVELVPGPHGRAAPWCTRAFGCPCGDLLARSKRLWRNDHRVQAKTRPHLRQPSPI
jgi:hypothetical protein